MTSKRHNNSDRCQPDISVKEKSIRPLTFFYAHLGFLIAFTLFLPGEQPEYTGAAHLPCILWFAAVSWVLCIIWGRNQEILPPVRNIPADKFVYVFFAWVVLSITVNLFYGGGWRPSFNNLSVWFLFATAYFLFRRTLQNVQTVRTVFALITAIMLAQALTGLYQQFVDIPAMQRQFDANPESAVAAVDPSIKAGSADWELLAARLKTALPSGTYPLSNSLGGLLACVIFLCAGIRRQKTGIKKYGIYVLIAVVVFCLALTKCRSGFAAAVCGLILLIVFSSSLRFFSFFIVKKRLITCTPLICTPLICTSLICTLLLIAALCFLLFNSSISSTGKSIIGGAERSLGFRLEYWKASLGMIADYPLFGCGSGNFKQTYTKYKLPQSSEEIADPHNFAVEIAAESGLPALVLFLLPLCMLIWNKIKKSNSSPSTINYPLSAINYPLYCSGLLGCWTAYFFSFNTEAPMTYIAPLSAVPAFPLCAYLFSTNSNSEDKDLNKYVFIALVVLLVHLSASGGISVPSTALLIWLFIAVLFNQQKTSHEITSAGTSCSQHTSTQNTSTQDTAAQKILLPFICTFPIIAMVLVSHFGASPVLRTRTLMTRIEDPVYAAQRTNLLYQMVYTDRWYANSWEQLANEMFIRRLESPNDVSSAAEAELAADKAAALLPRSAGLRYRFAERYAVMYEKTGIEHFRLKAAELYRDAIERYPNNAAYRTGFALFLNKNGKTDAEKNEALKQRNEALRLDDLMPHKDRKLKPEQRAALLPYML